MGIRSGIYTYANFWVPTTGSWTLPLPLWAPGHSNARTFAARAADTIASCERVSFTGGPLVITQWVWAKRDHDVTCAAIANSTETYWVDYGHANTGSPSPSTPASPTTSASPAGP
jgi:hypothetical protein